MEPMTPSTRREARQSKAAQRPEKTPVPDKGTTPRRRWIGWVIAIIVVVVLGCAIWLALKALTVKDSLESAQASLQSALSGGDLETAIDDVAADATTAAEAANDPLWRATESLPFLGDNLRGVRLASESLDVIVNQIGVPVLALQSDGKGQIMSRALPLLQTGGQNLTPLASELESVSSSGSLVGPVASGVSQVGAVVSALQPALGILPDMLGADGERNYLLVFQNNAEALPLGGSAASETMIRADGGDLEITGQASSAVFDRDTSDIGIDIPESAIALNGDNYGERVNLSTSRPDWPSAAQMVAAFWNRTIDDARIDGAISIDPLALSRILVATGPITVPGPDGDFELTSENAVETLLSKAYVWWDATTPEGALASDAFFAGVAGSVFEAIASGSINIKDMAWAVGESVDRGSILAWMSDPDQQAFIESSGKLSGILPTDNTDATTLGVYFRDASASKIDYYLDTSVTASMVCEQGTTTVTSSATLHLDIDQQTADQLPTYVKSQRVGSEYFSKHVFMYAPPGMQLESLKVDGRWVEPFREGNVDLGRVVAPFQSRMAPGETITVEATFVGEGKFAPLEVRTNPMIRDTQTSIQDSCHSQ